MNLINDHITKIDVIHGDISSPNATRVKIHFARGNVIEVPNMVPHEVKELRNLMMSGSIVSIGITPNSPSNPIVNPTYAFGQHIDDDIRKQKDESKPMGFSGCYHNRVTYDSGFSKYDYCSKCGHKYED